MNALSRHLLTAPLAAALLLNVISTVPAAGAERGNRELLEAYIEVWNSGEVERLDQILAPDFVHQDGSRPARASVAAMKEQIRGLHAAHENLRLSVHDLIAGPDHGALRFSVEGVYRPTGDPVGYLSLAMYRFAGGKIVAERVQSDSISYLMDLGYRMVPPGHRMVPPPVENAERYRVEPAFPGDEALRRHLAALGAASGKGAATLELESAVPARLRLDGEEVGWLSAGEPVAVDLPRGSHSVQALTPAGAIFYQHSFDLKKKERLELEIPSPGRIIADPRQRTSEDLSTGLMWMMQDDGQGYSWAGARAYCEALEHGGHDDWRLPTIFELDTIHDPDSPRDFPTVNGITLSKCCPWSSNTHGEHMAWIYVFYKGARYLQHQTFGGGALLALCVRDAVAR